MLSIHPEGLVVLWMSLECPGALQDLFCQCDFVFLKMVTFGPLQVPKRPQCWLIYIIMMYFPCIKGFRVVWSFSVHDLGRFSISASGSSVFSNSQVVTLDVCCSQTMSSPEFRRSQILSMGSVLNIFCMKCHLAPGSSCVEPIF